jgi:hypothetical protein
MSPRLRIALLASLQTFGCQCSSQPSTQPAPPPAASAEPLEATKREQPSPAPAARQVECRGGEVIATWQSAAKQGAEPQTSKISFAAAGHREWSYDFTYEGGALASARHRISSWSFAGGHVDHPNTQAKVVERRYELAAGKLVTCTERRAQGASDAIEQLVEDARAKDIECKQGAALVELAAHASQPVVDADIGWLATACTSDKSSGFKL